MNGAFYVKWRASTHKHIKALNETPEASGIT
jgi:hypothetical protein